MDNDNSSLVSRVFKSFFRFYYFLKQILDRKFNYGELLALRSEKKRGVSHISDREEECYKI